MVFQNPANGHRERVGAAGLWAFLFGPFYFGYKGAWGHAALYLLAGLATFGVSAFIYPFFAKHIIRKHYLHAGWTQAR